MRPFTALGQALLLAALLMIPGLGTVDYCLAKDRICHEAKAKSCCCKQDPSEDTELPCCVTLHQDWMLPLKELAKVSLPLLPVPPSGWASELLPLVAPAGPAPGRAALFEPPPPSREVYLTLIQVCLV
jgi:hypothetical protein